VVPWLVALLLAGVMLPSTVARTATPEPRLVSLDAEDAYLPSVLKTLAEKGDLNIIMGPGVTAGRLSIHMRNVPIDQAVNLVVRAAGLAYERIGNSVLVADPKSLSTETGLSSYVVELKYADAADVTQAISKLSAEVAVDKGGNRMIIVTSPRVIAEIQAIVDRLDVPSRQVMLEARVIEISTDGAKRLGIDWDLVNRQGTVIVEGRPADSLGAGGSSTDLPFRELAVSHDWSRRAHLLQIAIDLLIHEGNARVLANPKIATLNGREASILIGSRIPFVVTGTAFAAGAAAPVQQVQKEEVGIKLRITPLINPDGYITTQINPEVSSVIDFRGANNDLPVIATRQASTTVRLKDGSSVIIGGLLSEEKTSAVTKVPILGSLPLIGYLFQHHAITTSKRDLVIEVTPHIVPEQQ